MDIENVEQPKLAQHDATVLDLAFVMDCTGSMGSYIENARNNIRKIVEEIVASEKSDIKLALVEYRDHPPQDLTFVTRTHDFTSSLKEMKTWLDVCDAQGGGDAPEAVADGLHDALKLSWRENSTKICVLIADAPPHGLTPNGDTMPNGCPAGIDPLKVVHQMAEKGITLYSVGCEPSLNPYKDFFSAIAYITGGQYVPLRNADLLAKVIIGGAQEEISLERLMQNVRQEVNEQILASGGNIDEEKLTSAVYSKLKEQGAQTKNLKMNNKNIEPPSQTAMNYSKMADLSAINKEFKAGVNDYQPPIAGGFHFPTSAFAASSAPSFASCVPTFHPIPAPASYAYPISPPQPQQGTCDTYSVESGVINMEQTERLVQKALKRQK